MDTINKNNIHEDQFRNIISETKIQASDNLRYRIIQQIETERVLSKKQTSSSSTNLIKSLLSTFAIMYALIGVVLLSIYFMYGTINFESPSLVMILISIAAVCSVFALISAFDEKRRFKYK